MDIVNGLTQKNLTDDRRNPKDNIPLKEEGLTYAIKKRGKDGKGREIHILCFLIIQKS